MSLATAQNSNVHAPRLWIKRVALFASPQYKATPLRQVIFHRGLNIVWGVELSDDANTNEAQPVAFSGHSVGKTLLCRLIRYCLGESTFGRPREMKDMQNSFPQGWVGLELNVEEQNWVVLKPIDLTEKPKAAQAGVVEDLFEQNDHENKYKLFMDWLQESMLPKLQATTANTMCKWDYLLAWLSRDQESRFQSFCDWRSPRSGAKIPELQKHSPYLIRLVLNLLHDEELKLLHELSETKKESKQREERVAELRKEPIFRLKEHEEILKKLLDVPSTEELDADSSNMTSHTYHWQKDMEDRISGLQNSLEEIEQRIVKKQVELALHQEKSCVLQAMGKITEEAIEPSKEEPDDIVRRIRELRGKNCTYASIPFQECTHLQKKLTKSKNIDLANLREEKRVDSEMEKRRCILERQSEMNVLLDELRRKLNEDIDEKRRKTEELAIYQEKLRRVDYHLALRQRSSDIIQGRIPDSELQQECDSLKSLQDRIKAQKKELQKIQESQDCKRKAIEKIYDDLIKRAISETCSGKLRMPKGKPEFHIEEKTGLTGEAVETLALVLADVAAMICSCENLGYHPRFLIHDSPREADLDQHIYSRYLRSMGQLTEKYGGKEKAPFQYIVTTTSKPPPDVEQQICLRLKANPESEMLFRKILHSSSEDKLPLFTDRQP